MIPRIAQAKLMELAQSFKAVAVIGPRQSEKTTLVKKIFPHKKAGHEIDLIIDNFPDLIAVEIKSGKTVLKKWFKNLEYWKKLTGNKQAIIIYAGNQTQHRSNNTYVINWKNIYSYYENSKL